MNQPQQLHPDTLHCPTCYRPWPLETISRRPLTARELDALSAWWHVRSVKLAAVLIGVSEQRAKNLLARARSRSGVSSNAELVSMNLARIRSEGDLVTQHNAQRGEAE